MQRLRGVYHSRWRLLILACCVYIFSSTLSSQPAFSQQTPAPNKLGVHLLLDDGRNRWPRELWGEHMAYAHRMVGEGGFVVQVIRSDDLDPVRWQYFMDLCAELNLIPMLRLATTFDHDLKQWLAPPPDQDGRYGEIARRYADFVTALQWPTDAHYLIVGNEPNHGNEWGGVPDPAAYARFLVDVASVLHEADSDAVVLNAGFDLYSPHTGSIPFADGSRFMDGESFMDGMIAAEPDVFSVIDAWASHPYPLGAFREPPWEQRFQIDLIHNAANPNHLAPPAGIYNRGVNGYEWELFKLASYGIEELPVFITETGWRHAESTLADALDGGEWPDSATMAHYMDLALNGNQGRYPDWPETGWTPWLDDERVVAVVFFALDGNPAEWGHTNWLQVDSDGAILGTYAPFELLAKER